jgi:hypothetical protein
MNTVYNFYSEGVLNRFVLKIKSGDDYEFFDSNRAKVYVAVFSMIVIYGLLGKRRPPSVNVTEDSHDLSSDTSVKLRLL